jgi:hypothetical protein
MLHTTLKSTVMMQHAVKKELKLFRKAGTQAVTKELRELHGRIAMESRGLGEITGKAQHDALWHLMYLKEKQCGTTKGRGCANGRKQREHISKEETSSPTVAIESVAELLIKLDPKLPDYEEGKASDACTAKEGALWNSTSSAAVLEGPIKESERMGLGNQPRQRVCCEQDTSGEPLLCLVP